jgi:hypothetical protein
MSGSNILFSDAASRPFASQSVVTTSFNSSTIDTKSGRFKVNDIGLTTIDRQILEGTGSGMIFAETPFKPFSPTNSGIINITVQRQGLAFGEKTFTRMPDKPGDAPGVIGTYSYILASANAFVNRNDPAATNIPDIKLCIPDSTGNVYYTFDVVILYPTNRASYSGFMAVEGANRGQATMCYLEDAEYIDLVNIVEPSIDFFGTSVPGQGCGNGFRYMQGDMIVYTGWEATRTQSLNTVLVEELPSDISDLSPTNKWPGEGIARAFGITPLNACGLGIFIPYAYNNSDVTEMSGICTDYGYFPFSATGSFDTASNLNTFVTCYPTISNVQATCTIALNINGEPGTPIPLDPSLFRYQNGFGISGKYSTVYSGFSQVATPINFNTGYVTIDRDEIMKGTDGNPMTTSNVVNWNQYASVLQPDDAGYLRDYGCEYAITYTGLDTVPALLGQLGINQLVSYLRYGTAADNKFTANTVARAKAVKEFWENYTSSTTKTMMWGCSQSAELVRSFLYNGFNVESRANRPVFDCCFVAKSGASRRQQDGYRFAKTNEETLQHYGSRNTDSSNFPFAYQTLTDPLSGVTDGILYKYRSHPTCIPKIYHVACANDFFADKESLVVTDPIGLSILTALDSFGGYTYASNNVQYFYASGTSKVVNFSYSNVDMAAQRSIAAEGASQADSAVSETYLFRSCYYNLKKWVKSGTELSPIRDGRSFHPTVYPSLEQTFAEFPGSLVYTLDPRTTLEGVSSEMAWPDLSSLGLDWNGNQYVKGSQVNLRNSINNSQPVDPTFLVYAVLLPETDDIGNDKDGLPIPEMAAPLMTVRGYNTYIRGYNKNDILASSCSAIPLALNPATRTAGDPRQTITELYSNASTWLAQWRGSVGTNIFYGFMIDPDIFPYDDICYTNRGTHQARLLVDVHGLPP